MNIESLKASKKTDQLFLVCVDHYDTSHATFYYYKKEENGSLSYKHQHLLDKEAWVKEKKAQDKHL